MPVVIQPNAGLPSRVGERLIYLSSPAYMADYAARMVSAGARMVGGCCGTTPQHVRAMREALDRVVPGRAAGAGGVGAARTAGDARPAVADGQRRRRRPCSASSDAGEFLVTVELDPPRGHNIEKLVQGAKLLKERGVEIVDINDGSLGRVRMSVLPTAILVREATGLDINMHFTCRDRNLMGIQADVLGAHAMDIRNILAMTGDPPRTGDYVNATAVFDVDAIGLIRILAGMNRGLDATGQLHRGADVLLRRHRAQSVARPSRPGRWSASSPRWRRGRGGRRPSPSTTSRYWSGSSERRVRPSRSWSASCRCTPRVTPSSCTTRCRASRCPTPSGPACARRGSGDCAWASRPRRHFSRDVRGRHAGAYLMPSFGRFEVVAEVLEVASVKIGRLFPDLLATLGRAASPEAGVRRARCGSSSRCREPRAGGLRVPAAPRRVAHRHGGGEARIGPRPLAPRAPGRAGAGRAARGRGGSAARVARPAKPRAAARSPRGARELPSGSSSSSEPRAAAGSRPTRSRRASLASSVAPWSRSGGCISGRFASR